MKYPIAVRRFLKGSADTMAGAARPCATSEPAMIATIARGSSDHAAAFLKYAIELTAGVPVASIGPSIMSIYGTRAETGTMLRQSPYRSRARAPTSSPWLHSARRSGALCFAITNTIGFAAGRSVRFHHRSQCRHRNVGGGDQDLRRRPLWPGWRCSRPGPGIATWLPRSLRCRMCWPGRWRRDWAPLITALDGHQSLYVLGRGPSTGHRQRGRAQVQGNLRHPRGGLQRRRSAAWSGADRRVRVSGAGACRARCG